MRSKSRGRRTLDAMSMLVSIIYIDRQNLQSPPAAGKRARLGFRHLIAPVAFPWFQMAQNWISAFAHTMFGVAAGGAYIGLRRPKPVKA